MLFIVLSIGRLWAHHVFSLNSSDSLCNRGSFKIRSCVFVLLRGIDNSILPQAFPAKFTQSLTLFASLCNRSIKLCNINNELLSFHWVVIIIIIISVIIYYYYPNDYFFGIAYICLPSTVLKCQQFSLK